MKKLNDQEIIGRLESQLSQAKLYEQEELVEQRVKAYKHYYGEPFGNEKEGRSEYISRDVFNAVESEKAILISAFAQGSEVVKFEERTAEADEFDLDVATAYSNHVFYSENDGYRILEESLHDLLLVKNCIVKYEWVKDEEIQRFKSLTEEEVGMLLADENTSVYDDFETEIQQIEVGQDPMTGQPLYQEILLYTGEVVKDSSYTKIEVVPPELFHIDPEATCVDDARFIFQEKRVSEAELYRMGLTKKQISELPTQYLDSDTEYERQARHVNDSSWSIGSNEYENEYVLTMAWTHLPINETEEELYKIQYIGNTIIDKTPVENKPFLSSSCYNLSHRFWGMSEADLTTEVQYLKSTLMRLIMDNQAESNLGRYIANLGLIKNPRDLINVKPGGVVWSDDITKSVQPLPQSVLNPQIFQAFEMIDKEKAERTGISKLAQGLDNQALTSNNSGVLVENLIGQSHKRISKIARDFGHYVIKPLFQEIYRLGMENDRRVFQTTRQGSFIEVNPETFNKDLKAVISTTLTEDDREKRAAKLFNMDQILSNDQSPQTKLMYQPKNRYKLLGEAFSLLGLNMSKYLTDPQSQEYQQAAQAQEQQAQQQQEFEMNLVKAQADAAMKMGQSSMINAQSKAAKTQADIALDKEKLKLEGVVQSEDNLIDKRDLDIKERKVMAEIRRNR